MKYLIHFMARTAVTPLHFDLVYASPFTASSLPALRIECARYARTRTGRDVTPADIIIGNVIPMPE